MSIETVRAAIVATLAGIADIGRVHPYQRYGRDQKKFLDLYANPDGRIIGWYVRRLATREQSNVLGVATRVIAWQIGGFMGIDDAGESELAFDTKIEAICDAFRADETLGGTVMETSDMTADEANKEAGIQVLKVEPVMFCGVLCHGATLGLTTSIAIRF